MKKLFAAWLTIFVVGISNTQEGTRQVVADDKDPINYYGIMVANGKS